jgi:hypothetical protein
MNLYKLEQELDIIQEKDKRVVVKIRNGLKDIVLDVTAVVEEDGDVVLLTGEMDILSKFELTGLLTLGLKEAKESVTA